MESIDVCPSTLAEGFDTYSPATCKLLFDGKAVSHILPFDSPNNENADTGEYARHVLNMNIFPIRITGAINTLLFIDTLPCH